MNKITYVNEKDEVIGYGSREEAIEKGVTASELIDKFMHKQHTSL